MKSLNYAYHNAYTARASSPTVLSSPKDKQFRIYFDNTKLNGHEKPLFLTQTGGKAFSIKGTSVVKKEEVANFSSAKLYTVEDDEIVYSLESLYNHHIFVTCGKNFGTRELNTLASILLKLEDRNTMLHVQTFIRKCSDKKTQWVPSYNKKIKKLKETINQILGI